ncbi:hypothetical protein H8356DRAFT_1363105 [Neocallimastix lanati (nom. inval.)]|nr:hypothetical protein H8356DRAFT_1363105 [Neocallimastix sp. JGI-2020a]
MFITYSYCNLHQVKKPEKLNTTIDQLIQISLERERKGTPDKLKVTRKHEWCRCRVTASNDTTYLTYGLEEDANGCSISIDEFRKKFYIQYSMFEYNNSMNVNSDLFEIIVYSYNNVGIRKAMEAITVFVDINVVKGLLVEHQHVNCSDQNDCELHKQIATLSFINEILCGGTSERSAIFNPDSRISLINIDVNKALSNLKILSSQKHGRNSSKVFRRGLSHKKAFSCTGYQ